MEGSDSLVVIMCLYYLEVSDSVPFREFDPVTHIHIQGPVHVYVTLSNVCIKWKEKR